MGAHTLILTNCTGRKRSGGRSIGLGSEEMAGSLEQAAKAWARAVRCAPRPCAADRTYVGRSFTEATHVARSLSADLYVISAGLGVIAAQESIPRYNLTVSDGSGSIGPLLVRLGAAPHNWWAAMIGEFGDDRSVTRLLERHADSLALLALPSSYLALIAKELEHLSEEKLARVRILTSTRGQAILPERVGRVALPYDDRLEGSVFPGTRSDFPQRALRHFTEVLSGQTLTIESAQIAVSQSMRALQKPAIAVREKRTDAEIVALLQDNWIRFDGASTRLLRYLRDEALVACEQRRFRGLWTRVRQDVLAKI